MCESYYMDNDLDLDLLEVYIVNQTQKPAGNRESAPGLRALLAEREREIKVLETIVHHDFDTASDFVIEQAKKLASAEKKYLEHREATVDGDCQVCDYEYFQKLLTQKEARIKELFEAEHFYMSHKCDAPIKFFENDGTIRRLVYEHGDNSVGIGSGYIPDDNKWEEQSALLDELGKELQYWVDRHPGENISREALTKLQAWREEKK